MAKTAEIAEDERGLVRRLSEALASAGVVPPDAIWTPLRGGLSNAVWRVRSPGRDLVCKLSLPARATPLFPNDPAAEHAALTALAGAGLAPEPVAQVETGAGRCILYAHVGGKTGRAAPAALGHALRRLHRSAPPAGLRRVSCRWEDIRAEGDALASDDPSLASLRPQRPVAVGSPPAAFLHGDPVPGNVVATASGAAILIDWQCPAIGDPVHDLSMALSPGMQAVHGVTWGAAGGAAFLEAYADAQTAARFVRLEPVLAYRLAAHCRWRVAQGAATYAAGLAAETARLERLHDQHDGEHRPRAERDPADPGQ